MRAARRRSCLLRSTNNSWAAYVFAVPLPVRGRHRPKAGWLFSYSPGNSSGYAMSILRTRRKRLIFVVAAAPRSGRRAKRDGPTTGGVTAPKPRAMGTPFRPAKCLRDRSTALLGLAKRPDTFGSPEHVLSKHRRNVCTGDKRESRVTAARGESAANPLPTDPAVNCVEPQRPRRLIETDPRRGQVFRGGEGQPYWAVMRGGFMASGRVRCRRR